MREEEGERKENTVLEPTPGANLTHQVCAPYKNRETDRQTQESVTENGFIRADVLGAPGRIRTPVPGPNADGRGVTFLEGHEGGSELDPERGAGVDMAAEWRRSRERLKALLPGHATTYM